MKPQAQVAGVHPISAPEPCHLIEMVIYGYDKSGFDFGGVTQKDPGRPRSNWQVAYDEQLLEQTEDKARWAFFFHYLDLTKPLLTPMGEVNLPGQTPMPPHLAPIKYEEP